jgi:hypothetical protein
VEFVKIALEDVLGLPNGRPQEPPVHADEESSAPELNRRASELYFRLLFVKYDAGANSDDVIALRV